MKGYLDKGRFWTNRRYFQLNGLTLAYSDGPDAPPRASIHLRKAQIKFEESKSTLLIMGSEVNPQKPTKDEYWLQADSPKVFQEWRDAILRALDAPRKEKLIDARLYVTERVSDSFVRCVRGSFSHRLFRLLDKAFDNGWLNTSPTALSAAGPPGVRQQQTAGPSTTSLDGHLAHPTVASSSATMLPPLSQRTTDTSATVRFSLTEYIVRRMLLPTEAVAETTAAMLLRSAERRRRRARSQGSRRLSAPAVIMLSPRDSDDDDSADAPRRVVSTAANHGPGGSASPAASAYLQRAAASTHALFSPPEDVRDASRPTKQPELPPPSQQAAAWRRSALKPPNVVEEPNFDELFLHGDPTTLAPASAASASRGSASRHFRLPPPPPPASSHDEHGQWIDNLVVGGSSSSVHPLPPPSPTSHHDVRADDDHHDQGCRPFSLDDDDAEDFIDCEVDDEGNPIPLSSTALPPLASASGSMRAFDDAATLRPSSLSVLDDEYHVGRRGTPMPPRCHWVAAALLALPSIMNLPDTIEPLTVAQAEDLLDTYAPASHTTNAVSRREVTAIVRAVYDELKYGMQRCVIPCLEVCFLAAQLDAAAVSLEMAKNAAMDVMINVAKRTTAASVGVGGGAAAGGGKVPSPPSSQQHSPWEASLAECGTNLATTADYVARVLWDAALVLSRETSGSARNNGSREPSEAGNASVVTRDAVSRLLISRRDLTCGAGCFESLVITPVAVALSDSMWKSPVAASVAAPAVRTTVPQQAVVPGAVGLSNLGNTCFFNSAVQALLHCHAIKAFFLLNGHIDATKRRRFFSGRAVLSHAMADMFKEKWSSAVPIPPSLATTAPPAPVTAPPAATTPLSAPATQDASAASPTSKGLLPPPPPPPASAAQAGKPPDPLPKRVAAQMVPYKCTSPASLLTALHQQTKNFFSGSIQHDAQEVLSALLDALHEELNLVIVPPPYSILPDTVTDTRSLTDIAAVWWGRHIACNDSIISRLFHGQLCNVVTCNVCGHTSYSFDAFSCLMLPCPTLAGAVGGGCVVEATCSIESCLDAYCAEEHIGGAESAAAGKPAATPAVAIPDADLYPCERCKKRVAAVRRTSLWRLPFYLVICFKRFATDASGRRHSKNAVRITMPDELSVDRWMHRDSVELTSMLASPSPRNSAAPTAPTMRYAPVSVIRHTGSLNGGHYVASARILQPDATTVDTPLPSPDLATGPSTASGLGSSPSPSSSASLSASVRAALTELTGGAAEPHLAAASAAAPRWMIFNDRLVSPDDVGPVMLREKGDPYVYIAVMHRVL